MANGISEEIKELIKKIVLELGISLSAEVALEHPADISNGDYSSNIAMALAKGLKINPKELAEKIRDEIFENRPEFLDNVEVAGPGFINFYLSKDFFTEAIKEVLKKGDKYGSSEKKNKNEGKILIEYSSPNIAKPFSVGHLRSTIIGDSLAKILSFLGREVARDNHLGDWGTQFGKLIVAIRRWGNAEDLENGKMGMRDLFHLYVKFHEEAENNEKLEDEARKEFSLLEKNDAEAVKIWKECVELSKKEFDKIYKELGVSFDTELGESFFEGKMKEVLKDIDRAGIARVSEGATLIFFEDEKYPPLMIKKSDGATLYATRDLAADKYRKEKYGDDVLIINEVGGEQELYFKQLFEAEKLLGYFKEGQRIHVAHGLYRFKDGKMSTRKGNVIWLEDIIKEAVHKAEEFNKKVAEKVAIGAIKFNDLKRDSKNEIVFDWEEILNLKGSSGPYLQYSYARAKSILRKADEAGIEKSFYEKEEIYPLEKLACRFPEIVERAGKEYSPQYIANYLLDLSQVFNTFYNSERVIEEGVKASYKLALIEAFSIVLKNGLNLLGIEVMEEM